MIVPTCDTGVPQKGLLYSYANNLINFVGISMQRTRSIINREARHLF